MKYSSWIFSAYGLRYTARLPSHTGSRKDLAELGDLKDTDLARTLPIFDDPLLRVLGSKLSDTWTDPWIS